MYVEVAVNFMVFTACKCKLMIRNTCKKKPTVPTEIRKERGTGWCEEGKGRL